METVNDYENPLVSVIIPVYNVEDFVEQCIESVVEQTYENLEIIIVNDGSNDSSRDRCGKFDTKDKRVQIIDKENGGLSSARNEGIKIATGEYLCFVDSDDYIEREMIDHLIDIIKKEEADIACCNFDSVDEKSDFLYYHNIRFRGIEKYDKSESHELMLTEDYFKCYAWNKIYKRKLFDDIQYPVGKHYEDIITLYELIKKTQKIVFSSEVLYHYRVRESSITRTSFSDKEYDLLIPLRKIREENKNNARILAGCCLYYIYFLDDMILGDKWDDNIYKEYCELYDEIKYYLKHDILYGNSRKKQMMLCRKALGVYKILYKTLTKIHKR